MRNIQRNFEDFRRNAYTDEGALRDVDGDGIDDRVFKAWNPSAGDVTNRNTEDKEINDKRELIKAERAKKREQLDANLAAVDAVRADVNPDEETLDSKEFGTGGTVATDRGKDAKIEPTVDGEGNPIGKDGLCVIEDACGTFIN